MNPNHETSPDDLLDTFKGRGLKSIVFFTLVVHAVILLGTSVPFLLGKVTGSGGSGELSEEDRVKAAVKEATVSLRRIADQHNIKPQDLSSSLAGGAPGPVPTAAPEAGAAETPPEAGEKPDGPKSAIEKEIEKVEKGPEVPPIPEDEEVDLFR